jgi:hypothetical protein
MPSGKVQSYHSELERSETDPVSIYYRDYCAVLVPPGLQHWTTVSRTTVGLMSCMLYGRLTAYRGYLRTTRMKEM